MQSAGYQNTNKRLNYTAYYVLINRPGSLCEYLDQDRTYQPNTVIMCTYAYNIQKKFSVYQREK